MADIDIEKKNKNKSAIWLWVVGILAIVGIIWLIAAGEEEPALEEEAAVYEEEFSSNLDVDYPEKKIRAGETEELVFV